MKRPTLINLHLYFSGVSTFILLMFILSGSLHLYGFKETKESQLMKTISITESLSKKELEKRFIHELKENSPSYKYDYIKGRASNMTTRPTTRTFFTIEQSDKDLKLYSHSPNFTMRLMEFHKGHGPEASRKILATIGIIFTLSIITGIWLGLTVKKYLKLTIVTSFSGLLLLLTLFLI